MPDAPSSSAQAARRAIAGRLRELRQAAGLSGRGLSAACGWHGAKTSRIEHAHQIPSEGDLRAWCSACGADDQAADLIAATRTAAEMYMPWQRVNRTGMRHGQRSRTDRYEQTSTFRVYCSNVIPGPLQTVEYATALLSTITAFRGIPNDAAEAAAVRVDLLTRLSTGRRRFILLIEEDALRHRFGTTDVMAAQLGYLLRAMTLPAVSFGIIPHSTARSMWTIETFTIFDERCVEIELLSAQVTIQAPGEIELYLKAFARLADQAVYAAQARTLIANALTALG